jgi:replication initiation protein RepC
MEEIGTVWAAIAVIYVLQLYEDDAARNGRESRSKSPGGYFRALTRMVKTGKIDLAVELLAMRRRRMA